MQQHLAAVDRDGGARRIAPSRRDQQRDQRRDVVDGAGADRSVGVPLLDGGGPAVQAFAGGSVGNGRLGWTPSTVVVRLGDDVLRMVPPFATGRTPVTSLVSETVDVTGAAKIVTAHDMRETSVPLSRAFADAVAVTAVDHTTVDEVTEALEMLTKRLLVETEDDRTVGLRLALSGRQVAVVAGLATRGAGGEDDRGGAAPHRRLDDVPVPARPLPGGRPRG